MNTWLSSQLRTLVGAFAVLAVAGCCSTTPEKVEPAKAPTPAPAAKPKPAAPAPPPPGMVCNTRAFPTGDKSSSAVLLEKCAPGEVIVGQPFTYELRVTNLTSDTLEDVVVTDHLSDGFEMKGSSPQSSKGEAGAAVFVIGTLGAKETRAIQIEGAATGAGVLANCADVTYEARLCVQTNVVAPSLELTKEGPSEVLACDPITYKITVKNNGSGTARNVRIEDKLPAGLTGADGGTTFSQSVPALTAGQSQSFTVVAKATKSGTYENMATASADGGLTAKSGTVRTVVKKPALSITMDCPEGGFAGSTVPFTIKVKNTGDGRCTGTQLSATLPQGTTFREASDGGQPAGGNVNWNLGEMAPGAERTLSFSVRADQIGTVRSVATVSCVCADPASDPAESVMKGIPAILLEVIDLDDPVRVGSNVTYEIVVTNQGSADGTQIEIECMLEDEMQFVSATGPTGAPQVSGNAIKFAPLARLAPKAQQKWTLVVKAVAAGDIRLGVKLNSDQIDRSVDETEATNFYE